MGYIFFMRNSFPQSMDLARVQAWTAEYGDGWGYAHAMRVFNLMKEINPLVDCDEVVLQYAAFLHDWGAYPCYKVDGVLHAQRSAQIARAEIFPVIALSAAEQAAVLEAIELHDYRDPRPAAGLALLLREADMLDLLGVIGMAREFAWGPNNLQVCLDRIISRRDGIAGRLTLPLAQKIAAQRLERMNQTIVWLQNESGLFL
jgi:HD superfamily phosphodiesterase